MPKVVIKYFLIFCLAPAVLPILYWYFSNLDDVALWLWIWILGFAWTVFSKKPFETRGWFFLVYSVAVAVVGNSIFKDPKYSEFALSVEMFSQVMIVTGSGIGSNLLAHWMINSKK